jgi:uncharacterized damage-inducible protein DinB
MSEAKHLAEALTGFLLEEENGWFLPAVQALEGLSAEQAARSPGEKFNSPWMVLRHMIFWMEFFHLKFSGNVLETDHEEDWLPIVDSSDEEAFAADKDRLATAAREIADTVAGWSDEQLDESFLRDGHNRRHVIQGMIAHNSYHTNEIISVRHMMGYWLEQT